MAKETATYKRKVRPAVEDGRIEVWARTDTTEMIAQRLGISARTLYTYRARYQELSDALDRGRQVQIDTLKKSLFTLATGYEKHEVSKKTMEASDGSVDIITFEKMEQIAPSLRAITILLSNLDRSFHADPDGFALQQRAMDIKEKDKDKRPEEWETI